MSALATSRKAYLSDLTYEQWAILSPIIPASRTTAGGRPRTTNMREVVNVIMYVIRTGCQWDMLSHDLLPKSTVYGYFSRWRDDSDSRSLEITGKSRGIVAGLS